MALKGLGVTLNILLYNYRGVSEYHFPMYLKKIEFRFHPRKGNLLKHPEKSSFDS